MLSKLTLVILVGPNHIQEWRSQLNPPASVQVLIINLTGQQLANSQPEWRVITPPPTASFFSPADHSVNNFGAVRNWSLGWVKTEWVIFLDADEKLNLAGWREVLTAISQSDVAGYFLPRRDIFAGQVLQHGETGQAKFLRLFRTNQGRWQGRVHEKVVLTGPSQDLETIITHQSHANMTQFIDQISYFARLEASGRHNARLKIWWQILTYPLAKLLVNLLVKSGWRDGWRGGVYACVMSLHSLCVRIYEWEKLSLKS